MTSSGKIIYSNADGQVIWYGFQFEPGEKFKDFMRQDVRSRLELEEVNREIEAHAQEQIASKFGKESSRTPWFNESLETRSWVIGEAIAEAYLQNNCKIKWPWNMRYDLRIPNASLPGADLVGFIEDKNRTKFVFGEVKTSGVQKKPPSVMQGSSGLIQQVVRLANDPEVQWYLIRWLSVRTRGTKYEKTFKAAFDSFIDTDFRAMSLFGMLIRDTSPDQADLSSGGEKLAKLLYSPTDCQLVALHVPCAISKLSEYVYGDLL